MRQRRHLVDGHQATGGILPGTPVNDDDFVHAFGFSGRNPDRVIYSKSIKVYFDHPASRYHRSQRVTLSSLDRPPDPMLAYPFILCGMVFSILT